MGSVINIWTDPVKRNQIKLVVEDKNENLT